MQKNYVLINVCLCATMIFSIFSTCTCYKPSMHDSNNLLGVTKKELTDTDSAECSVGKNKKFIGVTVLNLAGNEDHLIKKVVEVSLSLR